MKFCFVSLMILLFAKANAANSGTETIQKKDSGNRFCAGLYASYNYDWKSMGYPVLRLPKLYLKYRINRTFSVLTQFILTEQMKVKKQQDPHYALHKYTDRLVLSAFLGRSVVNTQKLNISLYAGLRFFRGTYDYALVDDPMWPELLANQRSNLRPGAVIDFNYFPVKIRKNGLGILLNQAYFIPDYEIESLLAIS